MFDPIKEIENYKFYDRTKHRYTLSASTIGNDILQLWHEQVGTEENQYRLGDMDAGSIMHLGLEQIFKSNKDLVIEERYQKQIGKWTISGKMDIIDEKEKIIYDIKTGKNYSRKKLLEEKEKNQYAIQLAVYNWLLCGGYKTKILWILKDSDITKNQPVFIVDDVPIMDEFAIEEYINSKINLLDVYLDSNEIPNECQDKWTRTINKVTVNSKCMYYCKYSNNCKYFKPSIKQALSKW